MYVEVYILAIKNIEDPRRKSKAEPEKISNTSETGKNWVGLDVSLCPYFLLFFPVYSVFVSSLEDTKN